MISPPPHHPQEDTENPKTRNGNPPAGERSRSAVPPRRERPSEAAGLAATPAEGTVTLAALWIASPPFSARQFGLVSILKSILYHTKNKLYKTQCQFFVVVIGNALWIVVIQSEAEVRNFYLKHRCYSKDMISKFLINKWKRKENSI
jgi:hypothetical protein